MYKFGDRFLSPGKTVEYLVVGAVCRLYDRENLPYPSCNLLWKGKQPSWRRIGKRLIPDISAKKHPSYSVIVGNSASVITLFWVELSPTQQSWWYSNEKLRTNV